jgi:hypothetical protein
MKYREFIASVYDACGGQKAEVLVWLAVNADLVVFREPIAL